MDKLKDDVMQQSKPGKNHLNTNYSGLPLTCSCRDADLCIIILNKEIMDAIKETSASKKNIKNQFTYKEKEINIILIKDLKLNNKKIEEIN